MFVKFAGTKQRVFCWWQQNTTIFIENIIKNMKLWKQYEKQFYWKQSNGSYCKTECQVVYAIIGNISTAAFWGMYNVIDDEWHNNWETGCILLLSAIFSLQSNWQGTYSLHFSQFLYWSVWLHYSKSAISNWTETHAVQGLTKEIGIIGLTYQHIFRNTKLSKQLICYQLIEEQNLRWNEEYSSWRVMP